jgi:diaminopimelate decarboxylase/aspartate kinase
MQQTPRWVVLKFGGTSVAERQSWETIAAIVRRRLEEGLRPLVVCSAIAGATNALEALLDGPTDEKRLKNLRKKHADLAAQLGVDAETLIGEDLNELSRLARGAALVGEVSSRLRARVLAFGELMSTKLGAAFLNLHGLPAEWRNAREMLVADTDDRLAQRQQFLSASCCVLPDEALQRTLAASPAAVVVTQGFIARNRHGDTVLLGRGGSDTSAAYFAAMLQAERCEIWTDVPGIFSGDPRQAPNGRLLRRLDYAEALEITSMGAKVLHPRAIPPLRDLGIPIHIRCTSRPELEGTVIAADAPGDEAQVKAICHKRNLTIISMETPGMWQQVGFLADAFACFRRHGLSIDLVSTSETNVTVSLDSAANVLSPEALDPLLADLGHICAPRKIGPCASVSLVGRHIRTILHQLGPALEVFGESKIHLVSQAANDLNLTFVVDEDQADRLVDQLHELFFEHGQSEALLGSTWSEIFEQKSAAPSPAAAPWWLTRRETLLKLAAEGTPLYVYDEETLSDAAARLQALSPVDRVFYSIKANAFPPILKLFYERGLGFECVSPGEVERVLALFPDIDRRRVLFTPNFAPRGEYEFGYEQGVIVTLDNLHPLERWPEAFRGREIFVRVDPGQGRGHHKHVKTAGSRSKFGVTRDQFDRLVQLARANGTRIRGLHAHTGSGILTHENWQETATFLSALAERLSDVEALDLGGGLGVVERPGQNELDLHAVGEGLKAVKAAYPLLELWLEPGRFLVANAGVLLARATQTKRKNGAYYIGVDAGMNTLIRPALYGAYHQIVNLTNINDPERVQADVVGPICESGDVLGHDRALAPVREGDVLLVATVGAYGYAMSSNYNLRQPAREVFLPKG